MRPADFAYDLPEASIAQVPLDDRPSARLLVDIGDGIHHQTVYDLPALVGPGDVIVINDTRVLPARLHLTRATGGAVEVLLVERLAGTTTSETWEALVRPSRRITPGTVLQPESGLEVTVGEDLGEGRRLVRLDALDGVPAALDRYGEMPLPPYLSTVLDDPDRYQTVYANRPASAAAPTAGLHLTDGILDACRAAGAGIERLELVVGLDTFRPIAVDDLDDHRMHGEAYDVPDATLDACRNAERVIAVGTTTVRALESAARGDIAGRTELFIRRPFEFAIVDLLLTNFHLPGSTLLVMLDAFVGPGWRDLYATALAEGYRFLSFGDAMLVAPGNSEGAT
ncbi:MAG: tRNA preQ1(34) S-adenosylmethionine ribosyltransferase-isomerase QueA [Acidimicrobiales bacterium]|nr:tRNA preQ1(34) S-adenosylmethionine ribosyltransferase-isomerase QueA [Acidimicrobiales bacterium]